MKVAVSSTGPDLDATVSPRFGRCPYFVKKYLTDLETQLNEVKKRLEELK